MYKIGFAFLYGAFTHLIILSCLGAYLWLGKLKNGGNVQGDIIDQVPSFLINIFYLELIISVLLICFGIYNKVKSGKE